MGIPGDDDPRVFEVLSFLRQVNSGQRLELGKRVAVVGGGSSAMDAARTALRLGAEQVSVLYRRARREMPAADEEVAEALDEGVHMEFLTAPVEINRPHSALNVKCIRMQLGPVDDTGRPKPVPIEGSEFVMSVDSVIMAIGQTPETLPKLGCDVDRRGRVKADHRTLQTSHPAVFAAGDVVTGPASIIEAIAAGRRAAVSIDRFLGGRGDIDELIAPVEQTDMLGPLEEQEQAHRAEVPKRPVAQRVADFDQVELGLTEVAALAEAERCLRCDLEEYED